MISSNWDRIQDNSCFPVIQRSDEKVAKSDFILLREPADNEMFSEKSNSMLAGQRTSGDI